MLYYVTNCAFNRINYPEQIGLIYNNPPSYARVQALPNPYRKHTCWKCNHDWIAKVELNSNTNLSGEKSQYCPKCNQKSSLSTCWVQSDGSEYPFPKPIWKGDKS